MANETLTMANLPYEEPSMVTILITSSFFLLLNALSSLFNTLLYSGLISQILLGILYGAPGAKWLSSTLQLSIQQLGYLGLALLVYHGGLSTSATALRSNLWLSSCVALTGVAVPMGLSFALMPMLNITPLQAFAAGAALCSTSLGTTFTVLETSGLARSRLGVVLSSAAMIDDVIGLVMIRIITDLSTAVGGKFSAVTVVRPVLVSVAFALVLALGCRYLLRPLRAALGGATLAKGKVGTMMGAECSNLATRTIFLVALCTGAYYAGTSVLYAAYLAGAVVSWWDSAIPLRSTSRGTSDEREGVQTGDPSTPSPGPNNQKAQTHNRNEPHQRQFHMIGDAPQPSLHIFEAYYKPSLDRILQPFFFASIGFSIPITQLFTGSIIWRGIIYSILMVLGKAVCGLWLVRFPSSTESTKPRSKLRYAIKLKPVKPRSPNTQTGSAPGAEGSLGHLDRASVGMPASRSDQASDGIAPAAAGATAVQPSKANTSSRRAANPKPLSLYPSAILGSAMVARGEIGFLISALAESSGVFSGSTASRPEGGSSELFLVVTWAVLLCTLLGPIVTGLLVKRVRRLQEAERSGKSGRGDPLGIWGVM